MTCREWGQGVDDRISIVIHYFFSAKSTALIAAAPATLKHSLLIIVRRQPHVSRTNRFGTVVFGPDTLNCEVAIMEQSSGRQNLLCGVGRAKSVDLTYLPEFLLCARTRMNSDSSRRRLLPLWCQIRRSARMVHRHDQYRVRTNLSPREFAAALGNAPGVVMISTSSEAAISFRLRDAARRARASSSCIRHAREQARGGHQGS